MIRISPERQASKVAARTVPLAGLAPLRFATRGRLRYKSADVRIHPIQTGTVFVRKHQRRGEGHGQARVMRTLFDRRWTEPLPVMCWLIEHPEGLIMVDTGETAAASRPGHFPRWHPYFRRCVRLQVED